MNKTSQTIRFIDGKKLLCRSMLLTLISLITACAGRIPVQPVAEGTPIHLIATAPDIKTPDAKTAGAMVSRNAARGAGKGAVGGAGLGVGASIICGPFILFCAPVLAGGGAVIGLVAGSTVGAIDGGLKSLPRDKAKALQEIISATFTELDFPQTLQGEFEQQQANHWTIAGAEGQLQVTLTLDDLYIEQLPKDQLSLQMQVSMIVRNGPDKDDVSDPVIYEYRSPSRHVDYWLADDGQKFRADISNAFSTNVAKTIRTLKHGNGKG
jgi:hypothetical protein